MEKLKLLVYHDRNFYKKVLLLALPVALQNMITIGVNLTDTMMIGALGETQLSASSLATQFVNIFQTFCMGLSMGASVLASRFWGMKEIPSLKKTIAIMYRICIGVASCFAIACWLIPTQIMRMYTSDTELIAYGIQYLGFAVLSFYFHGLSLNSTIILRSIRKVRMPLIVSVLSFLLNILLNYILMFGKLGMPTMGIAGASLSTLIVRIVEFLIIFGYLTCVERDIHFRLKDLFMKTGDLLPEYVKISLPVFFSDAFMALGNNAVMMVIGRMGAQFVTANAIGAVITRLCTAMNAGVSQASAVITGNTLGEGKQEEVQKQGYAFLGIGLLLGVLSSVVVFIVSGFIISAYHLSPETARVTNQIVYAICIVIIFESTNNIMTKGVIRGGGDTKVLMVADSIFLWIASLPLGAFTGLVLHLPPFWVYLFLKTEHFIKTVWSVKRLESRKWIKKIKAAKA